MEQTLIDHPRLKVRKSTGSEGPRHDPYHYDELTIKTPQGEFVAHLGLAVYVQENGEKISAAGNDYEQAFKWQDSYLVKWTGYTNKQLERIADQIKYRCKEGGYHYGPELDGYPGESFCLCQKCGKMFDFNFDESAVV